jgi:hypothetical protein
MAFPVIAETFAPSLYLICPHLIVEVWYVHRTSYGSGCSHPRSGADLLHASRFQYVDLFHVKTIWLIRLSNTRRLQLEAIFRPYTDQVLNVTEAGSYALLLSISVLLTLCAVSTGARLLCAEGEDESRNEAV